MAHVCNQIRIDGPPDAVFDLVTTTRYWPEWHPATTAVSGVTDRPLAVGDQVRERAVIGGRVHEGTWTVVEHRRPARVLLDIDGGRIQIAYTFDSQESGTRLMRELLYRPQDFAGGGADPAALESRMSAQSDEALHRLKWLVEHQLRLERNKRITRAILERAFNQRDFAAIDEGFTADAVIHDPGVDFRGPAELRGGLESLLTAFPDFHFSVEEQLAEDDRVMIRYRGQGTQHGEFLGLAATGRRVDYTGILRLRLEGEKISDFWAQPDQLGLLRQLGAQLQVVAEPGQAGVQAYHD
jgi:predicted ester cyclase